MWAWKSVAFAFSCLCRFCYNAVCNVLGFCSLLSLIREYPLILLNVWVGEKKPQNILSFFFRLDQLDISVTVRNTIILHHPRTILNRYTAGFFTLDKVMYSFTLFGPSFQKIHKYVTLTLTYIHAELADKRKFQWLQKLFSISIAAAWRQGGLHVFVSVLLSHSLLCQVRTC